MAALVDNLAYDGPPAPTKPNFTAIQRAGLPISPSPHISQQKFTPPTSAQNSPVPAQVKLDLEKQAETAHKDAFDNTTIPTPKPSPSLSQGGKIRHDSVTCTCRANESPRNSPRPDVGGPWTAPAPKPDMSLNTAVPPVSGKDVALVADITPAKSIFNDDMFPVTPEKKKNRQSGLAEAVKEQLKDRKAGDRSSVLGKIFGLFRSSGNAGTKEKDKEQKQLKDIKHARALAAQRSAGYEPAAQHWAE